MYNAKYIVPRTPLGTQRIKKRVLNEGNCDAFDHFYKVNCTWLAFAPKSLKIRSLPSKQLGYLPFIHLVPATMDPDSQHPVKIREDV